MINLKVLTSTVREGGHGIIIAKWFYELVKNLPDYQVELIDLKDLNLPLMNEPAHPIMQQYKHDYTKRWSKIVDSADAFVFVLGEYNYGFPAAIKNAIDYLHNEWKYKPVAFVSYGGISAGLRSTQMLKQVVTTLSMMPVPQQVNIPFSFKKIDQNNQFHPDEMIESSAVAMMKELAKWSKALATMRVPEKELA